MKYFVYCRKSSEEKDRQAQSIESQKRELKTRYENHDALTIVDWLEEEQSAMVPGRPGFNAMLKRIERGEADGIIAWAVDRLARNAVDAGQIINLLDIGKLRDLKFPSYTFENTSAGKMMLAIMLSQSKYYSDALSENVKRGLRDKVYAGWRPGVAPIGYLNRKEDHTIISDPERLPLVREMWELMLTGAYSPRDIQRIMKERGLRTLPRKIEGGKPLSLSAIYRIFENIFFAGVLVYEGKLYPGKHEAVVSLHEFETVQRLLGRKGQARSKTREFAFTGLIRCGECGLSVTAEEKTKKSGRQYVYYHCTWRKRDPRCKQKSLEMKELEKQAIDFLESIRIAPELEKFAMDLVGDSKTENNKLREIEEKSLRDSLQRNETSRRNLLRVRIADQVNEAEFSSMQQELEKERLTLLDRQAKLGDSDQFEPEEMAVLFSVRAAKWFREGDQKEKRMILEIAGSNPTLIDQTLKIDAVKLFRPMKNASSIPAVRAAVEEVRTMAVEENDAAQTIAKLRSFLRRWMSTDGLLEVA